MKTSGPKAPGLASCGDRIRRRRHQKYPAGQGKSSKARGGTAVGIGAPEAEQCARAAPDYSGRKVRLIRVTTPS